MSEPNEIEHEGLRIAAIDKENINKILKRCLEDYALKHKDESKSTDKTK